MALDELLSNLNKHRKPTLTNPRRLVEERTDAAKPKEVKYRPRANTVVENSPGKVNIQQSKVGEMQPYKELHYIETAQALGINPNYLEVVGSPTSTDPELALDNQLAANRNLWRDQIRLLIDSDYRYLETSTNWTNSDGKEMVHFLPMFYDARLEHDESRPSYIPLGSGYDIELAKTRPSLWLHELRELGHMLESGPVVPMELPLAFVLYAGLNPLMLRLVGTTASKLSPLFGASVSKAGPTLGRVTLNPASLFLGYIAAGEAMHGLGNLAFQAGGGKGDYMDYYYDLAFNGHYDPVSRFAFSFADPALWPGWVHGFTSRGVLAAPWTIKAEDATRYALSRPKVETQGVFLKPWGSDPSKLNVAQRFGIKGQPERGYFELVWDLEKGFYSVHFKPTIAKSDAFNPKEKKVLFQALADAIPEGGYVSTWAPPGSTGISRGGIAGLNRFGNLGFSQVDTRPAIMKVTGEAIELPVWQKVSLSTPKRPFGSIRIGNNYYRVDPNSMNMGFPKIERIKINGKDFESIDYGPLNLNRGTANPESDLFGRFIDDGSEAHVFEDPSNPNTVLKVNTDWRGSLQDFFNKYILFRNLVPYQKPLTLKGKTSEGFPVMSQERVIPMTEEQFEENLPKIKLMLEEKGFKGDWEEGGPFSNGKLSINDVSPGNVGFDANGNIVFLDVHAYLTPWQLEPLPGMQIKSLMEKGPLLKQLSKNGTISVKQLLTYINRNDVPAIDKYLIGKALENHAGETHLDYNALRKEVLEMIPKYERVPLHEYAAYGMDRLGFPVEADPALPKYTYSPGTKTNTFTFESPGIKGNISHYEGNPIGHSRTYTTPEESDILHVMESQSDWAQNPDILNLKRVNYIITSYDRRKQRLEEEINAWKQILNTRKSAIDGHELTGFEMSEVRDLLRKSENRLYDLNNEYLAVTNRTPILPHMIKTYTLRLIQENLRHAAENGLTKMRYPTPETTAKIEGYTPIPKDLYNIRKDVLDSLVESKGGRWLEVQKYYDGFYRTHPRSEDIFEHDIPAELEDHFYILDEYAEEWYPEIDEVFNIKNYSSDHLTILKKYAEFPKQYEKLFGKGTVREVTDAKGNTWYEVDVPESYKSGSAEIIFKTGGKLKLIPKYKFV